MTDRERMQVELLRQIAATENGALAIVSHLGDWFPLFVQGWDKTNAKYDREFDGRPSPNAIRFAALTW